MRGLLRLELVVRLVQAPRGRAQVTCLLLSEAHLPLLRPGTVRKTHSSRVASC